MIVETLGARFARVAASEPDRPAITCAEVSVTRGELERRTNRLARSYLAAGVVPDSLVTIGLPNSVEFLEAAIAVWKCGATPQPVSARLPAREREAIIGLAHPSLVVGVDPTEVVGRPVIPAGFVPNASLEDGPLPPVAARCWKAPTSGGSTGQPKLIVSTQPATTESVEPFARMLGMVDDGTVLITGPLYHNAPFMLSACALVLGGHVVLMPRFDAAQALALAETYDADWVYLVPTMMARIWRMPEDERASFPPPSLRVVMHMAAPCPPWLKQTWIDWLGPERIWELYGATEVQSVTVLKGDEWLERPGTVGKPALGEMKILDSEGSPVPNGTVGELWMRRGEGVANTYKYIGAEARAIGDGWESVGDMGSLDDDGYLYLADRKSDMILVGGSNVYPAEIESALTEHPSVRSAVVIGLPDEDLGQVPHALLELDADVEDDELKTHLAERLVSYKIPRTFERVTEPLRDDAGKVRRSSLLAARLPGTVQA
ncbi:MAG: AMP-binding protein [Actinomycetota bacterium]|nr:AMP-binding protein [Actinomycetota bacterium]